MNKKMFLPTAALALVLASCANGTEEPISGQIEEISIIVTAQVTKATFSDKDRRLTWETTDIIHVYDENGEMKDFTPVVTAAQSGSDAETEQSENEAETKFTCREWVKGRTPTLAFYCGKASAPESQKDLSGSFGTEIPAVQTAEIGKHIDSGAALLAGEIVPATTENGGYVVEMKNLCGLVRFEIANAAPELEAVAMSDDDGKDLAGKVSVIMKDGIPCCNITEGRKSVTFIQTGANVQSSAKIQDGAYYLCLLPGQEITPVVTFTLSGGKQASYTHPEKVAIVRGGIADLGIIDGSIVFDKPYTLTLDFLNWNETIAWPSGSAIDAKSKVREFYTKAGHLIESSAPLGRTAAYGLYSFSEVKAGSVISLPAVPGMRLVKVAADLGGMPSKGYPNNSGAPFIATEDGTVVKGGEVAENAQFVIPEQGESEPDSEPYVWNLSGTKEDSTYKLMFTEDVQSFGLQSLTLSYIGEQFDDISGVITADGSSPASRQMTMNGSFTTVGGMFTNAFCGFRYRASGTEDWNYIAVNEHSGGQFSTTISGLQSGDYEYCACAGLGNAEALRRYGVPKTVHVTGEPVTLAAIDFSAAELPAQVDGATREFVITGSDGYEYTISGQVFEGIGNVIYYKNKNALYFGRVNNGGTVDGNACGFIKLPAPKCHVLKSIEITDTNSNKTYRVYDNRKSIYESGDKAYLGSVTNDKTVGKSILKVSGAEAGKTYYLCCPIFSYVSGIIVTYEK